MTRQHITQKRYHHLVVLVMAIFFVISFITNILNSIIVDVKESFNLSLVLTGFLPFSFFIAYGIMSIPAGFLLEKYGNKSLLSFSFLAMTVASALFVIFPGYVIFSLTLFTLGCCMAVLQVVINPMLRVAGGEEHFAFNSVLAQLVFGLASYASPFLYIYLAGNTGGNKDIAGFLTRLVPDNLPWASLYVVFSILTFIFLIIVLLIKYPKLNGFENDEITKVKSYFTLLKNKWTLLYFFGIFCYVGVEQGIGNWISQFLSEYHHLDAQTVGANTVAYFWAMLTVGCLLGLLLLKVLDSRKVLIVSALMSIIFLIIAITGTSEISKMAFPMVGFFISVMWSIIFSLALNSIKTNHGSLSGILCTGIAGGAIVPLIVGFIGDMSNLKTGMLFLIIPLGFILSIGFWANPLITNKTISLKRNKN